MGHPLRSALYAPMLVLGSMLSIAIGASTAKGLFPVLGPSATAFVRVGVAAIVLLAVWRPWRAPLSRQQAMPIVTYGMVLGILNLTFYEAMARLPIGIAIAIEFLGPLSVAFFMSRGRLDILWATLALVGVALLLPLTSIQRSIDPVGIAFALMSAVAWGCYIVIGKKAGASMHPGYATAIGTTVGFLSIAPFGAMAAWQVEWHYSLAITAIAVGVLSSAIPFSLEMIALKHLDSKTFGILLSLEPALGAMAAFLMLNEKISIIQCLAIGCVMTASIGATITSRAQSKAVLVSEAGGT